MKNNATISVIVPVYKVEAYLGRCVNSILEQSYKDFELILVDDGSPDRCGAICDEYAKKDPRVHVIHQANGGLSAARNAGIDWAFANSDSKWLTFIDSDDWIHRDYLSCLYEGVMTHKASVSICSFVSTEGDEPIIDPKEMTWKSWTPEEFFVSKDVNATVAWGKLYRKECFQTLRYPEGKLHEDEFTTYQILFRLDSVVFIEAPLYYYYFNQSSIMNAAWSPKRLAAYDALEQQIAFFTEHGFLVARRNVVGRYLMNITNRLNGSMPNMVLDAQSIKILKKKKRQNFTFYAKMLDPNNEDDAWALTKAFPFKMKCYWYWKAMKNKVSGVFCKNK